MEYHACKALSHIDSVSISKNTFTKRWEIIIDFTCYGDEQSASHMGSLIEILDVSFCPYCGERLVE